MFQFALFARNACKLNQCSCQIGEMPFIASYNASYMGPTVGH